MPWDEGDIEYCVDYWKERLLLDHWDIPLTFAYDGESEYEGYSATCEPSLSYLTNPIEFNMDMLSENESTIESTIIHELVHAVVSPLQEVLELLLDGHPVSSFERRMSDIALENVISHITTVLERMSNDE